MVALSSLLVIIMISIIVVRIGSVALTMTGLSRDIAMFQAQSAFSGTGFTTSEAESVVSHATRRHIIRMLMLMGNAGFTTVVATLVLTFYRGTSLDAAIRFGCIAVGLFVLWRFGVSRFFDRIMTRLIRAALARWTSLDVHDYAKLLEIERGYTVSQLTVGPSHWVRSRRLSDLQLSREGVLVLSIEKSDHTYYGVVTGGMMVSEGDTLTCYGQEEQLRELALRQQDDQGDARHEAAARLHMKAMGNVDLQLPES